MLPPCPPPPPHFKGFCTVNCRQLVSKTTNFPTSGPGFEPPSSGVGGPHSRQQLQEDLNLYRKPSLSLKKLDLFFCTFGDFLLQFWCFVSFTSCQCPVGLGRVLKHIFIFLRNS